MENSAVLKQYKQLGKDLEVRRVELKQTVNNLVKKNIEDVKTNEVSFYTNKQDAFDNVNRLKNALIENGRLLKENNINKDDVFLFSNASKKDTYNLQLQLLKPVSSGLKTVQTIQERAEGEGVFAENCRKKIDEFSLYVKIKDVKKIIDKSKIIEDIWVAEEAARNNIIELSSIGSQEELSAQEKAESMRKAKQTLIPLYLDAFKNVEKWNDATGYATFIVGITYERSEKLSEVFNKYGIENHIVANNVMNVNKTNKVLDSNIKQCSKIEDDAKKSIEKEFKSKKIIRNMWLFWAIAVIVVCIPSMDRIELFISKNDFLRQYEEIIFFGDNSRFVSKSSYNDCTALYFK